MNAKKVNSFNEGLDIVFTEEILEKGKSLFSSPADKKIESLETTLAEQKNAINVVIEKSKTIADVANLLFTMTSQGQHNVRDESITSSLKEKNAEIISEKGISYMKINESKIRVDPDSSLPTIASKLFDESKKQKGAVKSIEKLMKKTEEKLEKTIEKGEIAKGSVGFKEIRKKSWYERYRWFFTSDGVLAVGGRDSSSNSAIIRKYLEKNDKVFHAEVHGSPFFLLKGEDEELLPLSLEEVAHATVCFSRAWQISAYGMSSFWVNPDQVKKGAPTGQSMAKGSFMINGTRNFIKVSSLKLAVGIFKEDEDYLNDFIDSSSGPSSEAIEQYKEQFEEDDPKEYENREEDGWEYINWVREFVEEEYEAEYLDWLRDAIPGEPGVDHPILSFVADTSFSCADRVFGGKIKNFLHELIKVS